MNRRRFLAFLGPAPIVVIPAIKTASEEPFGYSIAESYALTYPSASGEAGKFRRPSYS
jgi:hypothetical protein